MATEKISIKISKLEVFLTDFSEAKKSRFRSEVLPSELRRSDATDRKRVEGFFGESPTEKMSLLQQKPKTEKSPPPKKNSLRLWSLSFRERAPLLKPFFVLFCFGACRWRRRRRHRRPRLAELPVRAEFDVRWEAKRRKSRLIVRRKNSDSEISEIFWH